MIHQIKRVEDSKYVETSEDEPFGSFGRNCVVKNERV